MSDKQTENTERAFYVGDHGVIRAESLEQAIFDAYDVEAIDYGAIRDTGRPPIAYELKLDETGEPITADRTIGEMLKEESLDRRPYDGYGYCPECEEPYNESKYNMTTECPRCGAELDRSVEPTGRFG